MWVAALLVLTMAWPVGAADGEPRQVTVTGEAEVLVAPDEVILTLGVETWDKVLAQAKAQNDERVANVLAAAAAHGVEAQHMQTDHISIEPRYRDAYTQADFIGYFVRKTVVLTLRDLDQFEDLFAAVLEAGANYVHGVQFRTTGLRYYRDQARALAVQAAREKAIALAGELNQRVGRPLSIREEAVDWGSWYNAGWGMGWGQRMAQNVIQEVGGAVLLSSGATAVGQIAINARVTVSFELK